MAVENQAATFTHGEPGNDELGWKASASPPPDSPRNQAPVNTTGVFFARRGSVAPNAGW